MEQRACYRVATHLALEHFDLTLELPDGSLRPARMSDVSARGLMARTEQRLDPPLSRGNRVVVRIRCHMRGLSLRLPAVVCDLRPGSDERCVGLAFIRSEGLERVLPPDLFTLFNRRRAPRHGVAEGTRRLSLAAGQSQRTVGRLRDLSMSGARICVKHEGDPRFSVGQTVWIAGRLGGEPIRLRGTVRRIREGAQHRLYGVEFDPAQTEYASQRRSLDRFLSVCAHRPPDELRGTRRISDRRVSERVRPDLSATIEVEISGEGNRSTQARLRDLSETGVGITVRAHEDPEFRDHESTSVVLRLPIGELELRAHVRRGLLVDDSVCYGLEFDSTGSENFPESQQAIRRFVEVHQASLPDTPVVAVPV